MANPITFAASTVSLTILRQELSDDEFSQVASAPLGDPDQSTMKITQNALLVLSHTSLPSSLQQTVLENWIPSLLRAKKIHILSHPFSLIPLLDAQEIAALSGPHALFEMVAKLPIHWNYGYDGCFTRSLCTLHLLQKTGFPKDRLMRVIIFASRLPIYSIGTVGSHEMIPWKYHTALAVKWNEDIVVIDPTLEDKPVDIRTWSHSCMINPLWQNFDFDLESPERPMDMVSVRLIKHDEDFEECKIPLAARHLSFENTVWRLCKLCDEVLSYKIARVLQSGGYEIDVESPRAILSDFISIQLGIHTQQHSD
ncbi:MAG: hypothetical protein A3F09_05660 [Chlamydiae bacterium RIFCSPHIGHO2_12_FULL_49_11]|nr:MAG: hypothetical protein A3F09_05660 [Chlamydiae bacterium RIFCSPHIGHO2_12_FULL_49_11]